jgi:hypothetical protein
MAVSEARFPLGPPASRTLAWLAIASVVLPVPFLWAPAILFYASLLVTAILAIGLAIAHRVRTKPRGFVVVSSSGVERVIAGKRDCIANLAEPFGVTVLASQARQRALLAVTTPTATRFIGVRLEGPLDKEAAMMLLERASIVADGDALAAHASDEETLSAKDAVALMRIVRDRVPAALERLYLSGTRGERITLDGTELRVEASDKSRLFDLEMPVEWRGFLFHEALGPAASIYQATWIRQGSSELVLVAPMPTELLVTASKSTPPRRLSQQQKLLAPAPDEPPPGDLRTGIERVFMLPVREALSRAPRPSRAPATRRASSPDLGA